MNAIEKLKTLCEQMGDSHFDGDDLETKALNAWIDLWPQMIALWEAGIIMGRAFNALAEVGGDDEALGSAMHQAFTHFAETQNALNAKAAEVLK